MNRSLQPRLVHALWRARRTGRDMVPRRCASDRKTIREDVALRFLKGDGIEIGALDYPLRLPREARVRYVDYLDAAGLHEAYSTPRAGRPLITRRVGITRPVFALRYRVRREQWRVAHADSPQCATDARMKLGMTLVVRNEADIIEANIDYHLAQGVDFVLVTDHGSDDGTGEILARYERDGVAQVIRDDREGHRQSERVNRMVRIAAERYSADWVINSDADEFWWPLAGNLHDVFASIPDEFGQIAVQLRHFLPLGDDSLPLADDPDEFYARLLYRERESVDLSGAPAMPKVAHRPRKDVRVAPGNHALFVDGLRRVPAGELIEILHFPMRGFEQFERKVLQTGLGYELLGPDSPEVGRDQMRFLEMQRAGELPAYFRERMLDQESMRRGLRDGSIVRDDRLAGFMSALRESALPPTRPDSAHARVLYQRALQAPLELERCQWELMQRERELASAKDQVRLLGEARDAQQAQAAELSERLYTAQHALHLLRESRLMRWTEPARRAFHRAHGYPRR